MSLQLMRPEIVGPIQILHDDAVGTCENNTGIWVFIIGCVILPAVLFRMDEDGIEKLPSSTTGSLSWGVSVSDSCSGTRDAGSIYAHSDTRRL
jgi:hypothetical protein